MSTKRKYRSKTRLAQAEDTRRRILDAAKRLFSTKGFDKTTVDEIAKLAKISTPTVFTLFKSKEGLLKELMNDVLFGPKYKELVRETLAYKEPVESLKNAPRIARMIHDAEKSEMGLIHGISGLSPRLRKMEMAREQHRYEKQENTIRRLHETKALLPELTVPQARDILWTLTSREIYRMLVIEKGWSSDQYEEWLRKLLLESLVRS